MYKKTVGFSLRNLVAYSSIYPWNFIQLMYKHNITVNIIANTIKKIANGIVHPPKAYETNDVAKAKMANTNKRIMAITNEIIGIYLGKQ